MKYWYVLFVQNGRERTVAEKFNKHFNRDDIKALLPAKEKWFIGAGKTKKEVTLLFCGYVFVDTNLNSKDFLILAKDYITTSQDIYRILNYGGSDLDIAMRECERENWKWLMNDLGIVETSEGFIEGDKIYIESGALKGRESQIKKIVRHKRVALIEIHIMGNKTLIEVPLNIASKVIEKEPSNKEAKNRK